MSRYWTKFSQRKVDAKAPPSARAGVGQSSAPNKTTAYAKPGSPKSSSFNRKTKAQVVKTDAQSWGLN